MIGGMLVLAAATLALCALVAWAARRMGAPLWASLVLGLAMVGLVLSSG